MPKERCFDECSDVGVVFIALKRCSGVDDDEDITLSCNLLGGGGGRRCGGGGPARGGGGGGGGGEGPLAVIFLFVFVFLGGGGGAVGCLIVVVAVAMDACIKSCLLRSILKYIYICVCIVLYFAYVCM